MGKIAVVTASALALGVVGGVAWAQVLAPVTKAPAQQVRLVQPADQSVPVPARTTATPKPVVVVKPKVAPKPVVPLKQAPRKAAVQVQQKAATVSQPVNEPQPVQTTNPAPPAAGPKPPPPGVTLQTEFSGAGTPPPVSPKP